jgi:hypothetical protein
LVLNKAAVSAPMTSQSEPWLELLVQQVRKTRFGSIVVTIHEGRVVQVERTEKVRLDSPRHDAATAWAPRAGEARVAHAGGTESPTH